MALLDQEKTEDPTTKRREDARDEGRVPRSPELATSFALLGGGLLLNMLGATFGAQLVAAFTEGLSAVGSSALGTPSAVGLVRSIGGRSLLVAGGWGLSLMAVGLVIAGPQARGVLSLKPLMPDFSRLSPAKNAGRLFGIQSVADLIKSFLKLGLVGFAVYRALDSAWNDVLALSLQPDFGLLVTLRVYVVKLLFTAGLCYLALAAVDYGWQLWRHEHSLRMSRQEVKEELKQTDGDPLVKQRLRSFARAMARKQMMRAVPKADVVITNPTHIAVALQYDPLTAPAPVVLAMGQRKIAERIKALAKEHGVPCIENKPLARALFASSRVGKTIPAELYIAVAEILAFVIRRRILRGQPLPPLVA